MPATYEPIATTTLGANTSSVTFSNIPQTYTDLVLITNTLSTGTGNDGRLQFNGDSSSIYSSTQLFSNGSTVTSNNNTNQTSLRLLNDYHLSLRSIGIVNIMNYSNSSMWKTCISRFGTSDYSVGTFVGTWRSNSAITSVTALVFGGDSFVSGSIFSLYGIKAA
jgi:hypothetical protein